MVCTLARMRRVNVHLEEELDDALAAEAARAGESKAALLRRAARELLAARAAHHDDPWAAFTGAVTHVSPDDRHHDEVLYDR